MTYDPDYFRQFMSPQEKAEALCSCGHDIQDEHREVMIPKFGDPCTALVCDMCDVICEHPMERAQREAYEARCADVEAKAKKRLEPLKEMMKARK